MYATPATGSGANSNDLEDYLLGKKRVDRLLVGDENQALGASHKNFIAVQHANTIRDTAAKVREDPLFFIKQQEQTILQTLKDNPLRLKEMQLRNGVLPEKSKSKSKKDKEKRKHRHRSSERHSREQRSRSRERRRSPLRDERSPPPQSRRSRSRDRQRATPSHSHGHRPGHYSHPQRNSRSPVDRYEQERDRDYRTRRDSRSPPNYHERDRERVQYDDRRSTKDYRRSRTRSPDNRYEREVIRQGPRDERRRPPERRSASPPRRRPQRERSYTPPRMETETARPQPSTKLSTPPQQPADGSSRAEKLAAMMANASSVNDERQQRLAIRLAEEKAEMELEAKLRSKAGSGGARFINDHQKRVFGGLDGGLGEYMRRGKMGLVVERD